MVDKMRSLFAQALSYSLPSTPANFGIHRQQFCGAYSESDNVVLLHSSSRSDKLYPEGYWRLFAQQLSAQGFRVRLPWGKTLERERAERIAAGIVGAEVLPKLNLHGVACVLAQANAVIALDTGLGHLSAALGVPTLSLYNSSPAETMGTYGDNQAHVFANPTAEAFQKNIKQDQAGDQALARLEPSDALKQFAPLLSCKDNKQQGRVREFQAVG